MNYLLFIGIAIGSLIAGHPSAGLVILVAVVFYGLMERITSNEPRMTRAERAYHRREEKRCCENPDRCYGSSDED